MNDEKQLHWLVRPSTIRKLWIGFSDLGGSCADSNIR